VTVLAATTGPDDVARPKTSHNAIPSVNVASMPSERSPADRDRHVRTICGIHEAVVSVAAR
jgi:hypothetical protein